MFERNYFTDWTISTTRKVVLHHACVFAHVHRKKPSETTENHIQFLRVFVVEFDGDMVYF